LVLVARSLDALEAAAAEVRAAGGQPVVEVADATDAAAVEALAARVLARDGVPDVIVNGAGSGEWRFIEELPASAGDRMLGAPFLAAYHLTAAFMAPMLARGRGAFVHVGSPASLLPWPGATAYCSARWALRGLHEALCADLAGTGLQSCHVILGEVRTAYFERAAGSHERIPTIGKLIPVMDAPVAGEIVAGAAINPRREVIRPFLLRLFAWSHWLAPRLVEALVNGTGAKRAPRSAA
jgi:short-subunit dehydrogenase